MTVERVGLSEIRVYHRNTERQEGPTLSAEMWLLPEPARDVPRCRRIGDRRCPRAHRRLARDPSRASAHRGEGEEPFGEEDDHGQARARTDEPNRSGMRTRRQGRCVGRMNGLGTPAQDWARELTADSGSGPYRFAASTVDTSDREPRHSTASCRPPPCAETRQASLACAEHKGSDRSSAFISRDRAAS